MNRAVAGPLALVVTALLATPGCRGKSNPKQTAPHTAEDELGDRVDRVFGIDVWKAGGSPEFVTAAEQAELAAWVEARLTADVGRQCRRPVLRGSALAGSAAEDATAVLRRAGPLADCYQTFAANKDVIIAALQQPDQTGHPTTKHYRPLDDPASQSPELAALASRCRELPGLLARAVGHEDACSIYLLGQPATVDPGAYVDLGWITAALGRGMARSGKLRPAIELALDQIRLGQDLARGEVGMVELMAGQTGVIILLRHLESLLAVPGKLRERELAGLAAEVDGLLDSQIHPAEALANDPYDFLVYSVLPAVVEPAWRPAGGWGYQGAPVREAPATRAAKQGLLIAGFAARDLAADHAAHCPANASIERCVSGMDELAHRLAGTGELLSLSPTRDGVADLLRRQLIAEPTLATVRQALQGEAKAMFDEPRTVSYLRRRAFTEAGLMGVRLLIEARRRELATGRCPRLADFAAPPLSELRSRPGFGGKLTVESREPGTITVLAPAWVDYKGNPPVPVPIVDLCCAP